MKVGFKGVFILRTCLPDVYTSIFHSELGKDGCMSEFSWSSGGNYGKQWGEHLPTDAGVSYLQLIPR